MIKKPWTWGISYILEVDFLSSPLITFTKQDLSSIHLPHDDRLIIKLQIEDCVVSMVLVDGGSSADILSLETFDKVGLNRSDTKPSMQLLVSFNNDREISVGVIRLKVHTAERVLDIDFLVIDCYSTLDAIMGRIWIHSM